MTHPRSNYFNSSKMNYKAIIGKNTHSVHPKKLNGIATKKFTCQISPLLRLVLQKAINARQKNMKDEHTATEDIIEPVKQKITKRTIFVMDEEYVVELPENYDIYEGLRLYYPKLYMAVLEEEDRFEDDHEVRLSMLDYMEWLYD